MSQLFKEITGIASEVRGLREAVEGRLSAHTSNLTAQYKALDIKKQDKAPWVVTINIAANGDDSTGDGSEGKPYKTFQKAVSVLSGMVGNTIAEIKVGPGTYEFSNLFFHGAQIAKLAIYATDPKNKPVFSVRPRGKDWCGMYNHHGVKLLCIRNINFKTAPSTKVYTMLSFGYDGSAELTDCEIDADSDFGISVSYGCAAWINNCMFRHCSSAVRVAEGGAVHIHKCATDRNTVSTAVTCWGASAFINGSPNLRGKITNVVKNNALVVGL